LFPYVDGRGVMKQAIEDRRRDDGIAQDIAPRASEQ
jgi:hypothetical protein